MNSRLAMYRILIHILFLSIFFSTNLFSQSNWINSAGGLTHDEALDVCHDQNGNYYVTGYFTNAANFGTLSVTGFGFSDIFIAKYNSAGQPQWVKKAGGSGPDRGYSIYCDQNGNLFVTGYFTGPATFESTTLNSNANSQDLFIAKYDTNGNLQWVNAVGGNLGDTGYGITSDNSGSVIVTGQYKGTANFGSTTLTSVTDPNTNQPSFDVFVVKYDSNGNFLWVQNGAAEFDDRGMDLATDDANNIFVVGQYSDTIVFDNVYNNQVMNAGFVLKLDANGVQQSFKSMSGVQTLVYSVAIDNSNNVFITGDFRGTLAIVGTPSTYVNAGYYNKIFVAKFDNALNVLWAEADASDNEVTSKSIDLDVNGDAYITGLFKCRFNEYSDLYGDAIFYSAGYRDVFVTKYSSSGTREWMRHFGGPKDDYCSGIAVRNVDDPFVAGSYEYTINLPTDGTILNHGPVNVLIESCSFLNCEPNYSYFVSMANVGQKDIFLTKPYLPNRQFFDYFVRGTSSCIQDTMIPCVSNCLDTVNACLYTPICMETFTCNNGNLGLGPYYNFLWNTGSTDQCIGVNTTGNYLVNISREDGCMSHSDTVHVIIHAPPDTALITDSWSINVLQPPQTFPIFQCGLDTIIVTASNLFQSDTFYWGGGSNYSYINDSTIQVTSTGNYTIVTENEYCYSLNEILIEFYVPIPIYPTSLSIHYSDSIAELTDTLTICKGETINVFPLDVLLGGNFPQAEIFWHYGPAGGPYINEVTNYNSSYYPYDFIFYPDSSGDYEFFIDSLFKYCDSIPFLTAFRPLHVIVNPNPFPIISVIGPTDVCPFDTLMFYYSSNASSISITGNNILNIYTDSVQAIANPIPNNIIDFYIELVDTITGCKADASYSYNIDIKDPPIISMFPADGIVCPFDSILLVAPFGNSYQWVGPNGNFIGNTQQIYVDVPGYYHCIVEDTTGCQQTSNFVEAKEYNTPFLDVFPSNHICSNGNTTLTVIASSSALIQWQAPLSGSSTTQVVNSPGTYVCHITLCGITTIDSITVIQSNTPANIYGSDSIICPGDTLLLYANGGMVDYQWNPGGSHDNYIYVTQPGSYTVMTTDAYGCFGNSLPFTVYPASQPAPPVSSDTLICAGQSITLNATATNSVLWFTSVNSPNPIFTGNNFTTPIITNNTSYFIQTFDSTCGSVRDEININVYQSSVTPIISGDTTLCEGQLLNLFSNNVPGADYFWTGPNGLTSDSSSLFYFPVDSTYNGVYTLYYSDTSCTSPIVSVNVSVNPIPQPYILPDTTIYLCAGNSVTLTESIGYSSYLWNPGNQTGNSIVVSSPGNYFVSASENGCIGNSNIVTVSNANPSLDPIVNNITVCENTSGTLTATGSGTITWYDENMNLISIGNSYTTALMDTTTMFYVLNTNSNGCESNYVSVFVLVPPLDSIPPVFYNQPLCEGGDLYLYTIPFPGATYNWTGPNNFTSTLDDPIITNVSQTNAGVYSVIISLTGCSSLPGMVTVTVNPNPIPPVITGSQIYCEGDNVDLFSSFENQNQYFWISASSIYQESLDSNFVYTASMSENGNVILYVMDSIGCYDSTLYNITVNPTPYGSVFISQDICTGGNIYLNANNSLTTNIIWNGPNNYNSTIFTDSVINASSIHSGNYTATFTLNSCTYSDSVQIIVSDYPVIELGEDTSLCAGGEILYSLNPNYNYVWQDLSTNNEFTALDSGWVFVNVSIYPGCETNDSVYIDLMQCSSLFPNVFSPNGDGLNEAFLLMNNEGAISYSVNIYDRWGRVVFRINEQNNEWIGTDMQLNELPEGVYFWIAEVVNYFHETERHQGFVHLMR